MSFGYNMSHQMAVDLLKSRKGTEKNLDPQKYLIKVVNEQFGLMYEVTEVHTTL